METVYSGASKTRQQFDLNLVELAPGERRLLGDLAVCPARVRHGRADGPFFAYRIEIDGRTIAYSGDTEWVEGLIEIGRDADLFICESYSFDKKVPLHIDYVTLAANLPRIQPKRLILTHMSEAMLKRAGGTGCEVADDGLTIDL